MTARLGPEWRAAPDGRYEREAARLVVFDPLGRLLLMRGHTVDRPEESWWFTAGGGIEAGEQPRQAAVRELFEETGMRVDAAELVGPVWRRTSEFVFLGSPIRQRELYFVATVAAATDSVGFDTSGWTEIEREFVDELRWWSPAELAASREVVYPAGLAALAAVLVTDGWDGTVRELEPEREADV